MENTRQSNTNTDPDHDAALNRLCDTCRSNFPPDKPWPWHSKSDPVIDEGDLLENGVALEEPSSLWQLHLSSAAGCHLCALLLEAILPEHAISGLGLSSAEALLTLPSHDIRLSMLPDICGWVIRLRVAAWDPGLSKDIRLFRVSSAAGDNVGTKYHPWTSSHYLADGEMDSWRDAVQIQTSTNISPASIEQVKSWLRVCAEEHCDCMGHGESSPLPPGTVIRLVDIGVGRDEDVRIVEVGSDESCVVTGNVQYVTLSYRWTEDVKRTNLKRANKLEFHSRIPTQDWPKVYHDAVSITRQLGFRYLWIDSLCIIQDDPRDWKEQAALMGGIYNGGELNLAAVEAERSPGLETRRNPLRVAPCLLNRLSPDGDGTSWLCFRPDDIRKTVDRAPLYRRGWCFQERVLSRRTVHFGDQLFWECTTHRASESFPVGTDFTLLPEYLDLAIKSLKAALNSDPQPSSTGLHRVWCSVVRYYTQTQLTEPSDRLIALKGIANAAARRYNLPPDAFLAGLWKPHLAHQLLWAREIETYSEPDENVASRLANHFPSWSWASQPGESRFVELEDSGWHQAYIQVENTHSVDDNEGAATPSLLVLRASLLDFGPVRRYEAGESNTRRYSLRFTSSPVPEKDQDLVMEIELDMPVLSTQPRVFLLPLLLRMGPAAGLILASAGRDWQGMPAYRRIGIFHCDGRMDFMDVVTGVRQVDELSRFVLL